MSTTHGSRNAALLLLCLALACGGDAPETDADTAAPGLAPITEGEVLLPGDTAAPPIPGPLTPRPPVRSDTLMIEGMAEPVQSRLVTAPEGYDVPFSTYVPPGIEVEFTRAEDGAAARFGAAFEGMGERNAYMHVRTYAPDTNMPEARSVVGGLLRSRSARLGEWQQVEAPSWATEAYTFQYVPVPGEVVIGRALLARHGPRFVHVITHYPAEYGDGLEPRFRKILEHWRWEDTGARLIRSP